MSSEAIWLMDLSASPMEACTLLTLLRIWELKCSARVDSLRTSSATTANPRPASPARAASIAALSDSRLVCLEMESISPSTSRMPPTCWLTDSIFSTSSMPTLLLLIMPLTISCKVAEVSSKEFEMEKPSSPGCFSTTETAASRCSFIKWCMPSKLPSSFPIASLNNDCIWLRSSFDPAKCVSNS